MAGKESVENPWFRKQAMSTNTKNCSLQSVMDEELAKLLQNQEERHQINFNSVTKELDDPVGINDDTCNNDHVLAQMLQAQYDFEHDHSLEIEERKVNGTNGKVTISYDNYRCMHPMDKKHYDEDGFVVDTSNVDSFSKDTSDVLITKPEKKTITTKHDYDTCARKNAKSMEVKFPPDFRCGDLNEAGRDIKIPNHVYNSLKQHTFHELRQSHRLHEKKEHSTHEQALDEKTRLMMYKLVNSGVLETIDGCFSTGKESCVFYAEGGRLEDEILPTECAIKVYKTTLNEFKNREDYIKDDFRFKDRFNKQNPRKIVRLWAEKEMHNLRRLQTVGIACPRPLLLKKHVLLMSFIGFNRRPAPKLKEAYLSDVDISNAYSQCLQVMRTMYREANLVHADLSEYNILWHEGKVWIIDVSQSVDKSHPKWAEFLLRDCRNISGFFERRGIQDVMNAMEMFNFVTGMNTSAANEKEFLAKVFIQTSKAENIDVFELQKMRANLNEDGEVKVQ